MKIRESKEGNILTEKPSPDGYAPKKSGIAYKVFKVKNGKLYPPMVANAGGADTPVGVWLDAEEGEFAGLSKTGRPQVKSTGSGNLSYRPGWHLGDIPRAKQFDRLNKETGKYEFPKDFVWAECEYAMDVDYQPESDARGYERTKIDKDGNVITYKSDKYQHSLAGLPKLPTNGYYKYRTNPNPDTVPWVITGQMKVNRLLSDDEVNDILRKNGIEPIHRQGGDKTLAELGLNSHLKENRDTRKTDRLNEMALYRQDALERCIGLGKKFVEHFDKIYNNRNSIDVEHWKKEMEGWWNKVKDIQLKPSSKRIYNVDLIDWFFDGGESAINFMTAEDKLTERDVYEEFEYRLLGRNTTVIELIDEMLLRGDNESMKLREWDESPYEFIKSKEVLDNDGFITDYTWYYDSDDGIHFFMFGDRDLYTPNRDYADWECDTYEEAEEWFYNYDTEEYIDDRFDESLKEDISDDDIQRVYKKLSKLNGVNFEKLEDEYLRTKPSLRDAVYKFYGTILNAKSYCKDFIKWVKEEKGIDLKGLPCKKNESLKEEEEQVRVIKYYFPITIELEERGWGWDEDDGIYEIPSSQARQYIDNIRDALEKEQTYVTPEEMGEFTRIPKVQSVEFDVGTVYGDLCGIAKVAVLGELTEDEEKELIDWIEGQNSDGFGEGFEQDPIEVDDGVIYVHFWEPRGSYFVGRI